MGVFETILWASGLFIGGGVVMCAVALSFWYWTR